jgi:hypothetical protein
MKMENNFHNMNFCCVLICITQLYYEERITRLVIIITNEKNIESQVIPRVSENHSYRFESIESH